MKRYLKLLSLFGLLILSVAPLFNSKEARAAANTFCAKSFGQVDSGDFGLAKGTEIFMPEKVWDPF